MTRKLSLTLVICLALTGVAFALGSYELDQAKAAMDRGDFRYAMDQFRYLSQSNDPRVAREAAYFTGFCFVKMQDPWNAIRAYEDFLSRYDRYSDNTLLPDAMYVLGRTYEEVSRYDDARRIYRRCLDRFPYGEFASKCQDRMRVLGGGGYHPPNPPYPPPCSGITPEIADMIDLARRAPDSYSADQMLLKAAGRARTGADFSAISKASRNQYTQFQVFETARSSRVFRMMSAYEAVDLAKTTSNSYYRNQFILAYAQKCARTAEDFRILMDGCNDSFTKSQILQIAQGALGSHGPNFSMDIAMSVQETGVSKAAPKTAKGAKVAAPAKSDPFVNFEMDQKKVQRVSWFLDAVKFKKSIDETSRKLTKSDMGMEVVRQSLKDATTQKKFETLHQTK